MGINQKGFILMDSILGMVILSVALTALVSLTIMGIKTYSVNNEQTKAYQIASSYAEALQSLTVSAWSSQVTSTSYQKIDTSSNNPTINSCLTNVAQNLNNLPGSVATVYARIATTPNVGSRLAQVQITISWANGTKSVQLDKYYIRDITSIQ